MRNTTRQKLNIGKPLIMLGLLAVCLTCSALSASAASLSFSVNGTNAATGVSLVGWANFVYNSAANTLSVQVINGGGVALQSSDVLSGIYFQNTATSIALTPVSASPTGSSIVWNGNASNVGSNWQFSTGVTGAGTSNEAINTVSGITAGMVNGLNNKTTNSTVLKTFLVQNEITFNLSVGAGFSLSDIENVYFQYGGTLSGPRLLAKLAVPEPGSVALLASMGASSLLVGFRRYRRLRAR